MGGIASMMLSLLMSVPWSISSFAVDRSVGEIDEEVVHEKTEDLELAEVVEQCAKPKEI